MSIRRALHDREGGLGAPGQHVLEPRPGLLAAPGGAPPAGAGRLRGDRYFSSKGHDVPGLHAVLLALGALPFSGIHQLRPLGRLPGHPDTATPGIVTNTGSLGMGISKAKGMVLADRALGRRGRVFVLLGDGELQEGQIWESMLGAASLRLHEITAIVDHNRLQSDTFVERTSSLGDLRAKFAAFGWHVEWVDGHDLTALGSLFERLRGIDSPKVVIADTVKGRGVSLILDFAPTTDGMPESEADFETYRCPVRGAMAPPSRARRAPRGPKDARSSA